MDTQRHKRIWLMPTRTKEVQLESYLQRNIILGERGDFETIDSIVEYASEQYFSKLDSDMIKFTREKGKVKGLWKTIYQNEGVVIRGNNNEYSFKVKNFEYAEWF